MAEAEEHHAGKEFGAHFFKVQIDGSRFSVGALPSGDAFNTIQKY